MFDPDTVTLMSNAPSLDGLNQDKIPQMLTEAYAEIVAARIRMRDLKDGGEDRDNVPSVIEAMRRLAFTQEAFVATSEERENRASASFVAGAAHHACLLAESLLEDGRSTSSLSFDGISPEISATLLFLSAEASADAAEMAKYIRVDTDDHVEAALLFAIKYLATGQLTDLLALELPTAGQILQNGGQSAAVRALYNRIFIGIRIAAALFLGEPRDEGGVETNPQEILKLVQELCIDSVLFDFGHKGSSHNSLYPGPLHLASLLSAVFKDFLGAGVISVPPPSGIDGNHWLKIMGLFAQRRPYLWRNHRQAITLGYLEDGTSSAVSFPTGAGKSTLSELKIAVSIILGKKVIFLAPTLSLVDQTSRAMMETFPEVSVFRERANDLSLGLDDQSLPEISVLTPERCLALFNFNPDVFDEIGLVVFDECHLLHPRSEDKSRRAVDAMMCILNLGGLTPAPDMLFLSAMMKNSHEIAEWLSKLTGRACLSLDLLWKPTRQVRGCVVYGENEIKRLENQLLDVRSHVDNKAAPKALRDHLQVTPFGFFCLNQTWQSTSRSDYSLLQLLDKDVTLTTGEYLPNPNYG